MSRDHYIPQFILRGFAIDDSLPKDKQVICVLNSKTKTVENKLICNSFMQIDYNSKETEQFLAQEIEYKIGNIFNRIKTVALQNQKCIELKEYEYKALFRFFVIMWRRNAIQVNKMKEVIDLADLILNTSNLKNTKDRNIPLSRWFEENQDSFRKTFFDYVIPKTTNTDETVLKTILNYKPCIIKNETDLHFTLHNTYSTLNYFVKQNTVITENDAPVFMIYPISKTLCFFLLRNQTQTDLNQKTYTIPFESWDKESIKSFLINGYVLTTADYYVVDETNYVAVLDALKAIGNV